MHSDIQLDFNPMMADQVGESGLKKADLDTLSLQISEIHRGLTDLRRLGQMPYRELPYQEDMIHAVLQAAKRISETFETILVIGIGGSSLGGRLLCSLQEGYSGRRVIFCDSLDVSTWKATSATLDFKKTAVVAISKSGQTLETLAALFYFKSILEKAVGKNFRRHLMLITDPSSGPLRRMAEEETIASLEIPTGVGGRYSVLCAAGLFPAACVGVDIQEVLAGAQRMDERCKREDPWFNPAMMNAMLHYLHDIQKGRKLRILMPYGEKLKVFGPWFSQLWAESLGKKLSLKGKEVLAGSTPVCATGPQDQHSQLQLYLEGPQDKTVTFLAAEREKDDIPLASELAQVVHMPEMGGKTVHELSESERIATQAALSEAGRPHETVLLREFNAGQLGQLIYMAEVEIVYAGELYNVNPFDQPAVEKIKKNIPSALTGFASEKKNRSYLI